MNHSETHAGIVDDYYEIFDNIETVRWQDAVLGIVCSIILLTMRVSQVIYIHIIYKLLTLDNEKFSLSLWGDQNSSRQQDKQDLGLF